jgi:hypothetical protein
MKCIDSGFALLIKPVFGNFNNLLNIKYPVNRYEQAEAIAYY